MIIQWDRDKAKELEMDLDTVEEAECKLRGLSVYHHLKSKDCLSKPSPFNTRDVLRNEAGAARTWFCTWCFSGCNRARQDIHDNEMDQGHAESMEHMVTSSAANSCFISSWQATFFSWWHWPSSSLWRQNSTRRRDWKQSKKQTAQPHGFISQPSGSRCEQLNRRKSVATKTSDNISPDPNSQPVHRGRGISLGEVGPNSLQTRNSFLFLFRPDLDPRRIHAPIPFRLGARQKTTQTDPRGADLQLSTQ